MLDQKGELSCMSQWQASAGSVSMCWSWNIERCYIN